MLVRPQLGENIGAVARAMSNFGLSELRLVAPRDGWPNPRALEVASGGQPIIEAARLYPDFGAAIANLGHLYATTARPRDMAKRAVTPQEAMGEIGAAGGKAGFVFGPERTGLENEEVALCDTIVIIPTAPENPSLNIAQSAVVLGYEWYRESGIRHQGSDKNNTIPDARSPIPAPKADMLGLFDQLEIYLDEANYYRVAHKKTVMWQNMQTMLLRGRWSAQEVQSFRGMLRVLWEGRKPRGKS